MKFGPCISTQTAHTRQATPFWAVVVLAKIGPDRFVRLGHFAGHVVVGSGGSHQHLGAAVLSSYSAELSALAWAAMFLLQLPVCPPSSFHYDALSAGMCAQGQWQGKSEQQLLAVTRALLDIVRSRALVTMNHVKSHTGHPWNEYADRAAAFVARPGSRNFHQHFVAVPLRLSTPHRISWAAALFVGQLAGPQYPLIAGTLLCVSSSRQSSSEVPALHAVSLPRGKPQCEGHLDKFNLNLLQANVLTMADRADKDAERNDPTHVARRVYLDRTFLEASVQIAGLQECRSTSGLLETQGYLVWKGGSDKTGQFWVRTMDCKIPSSSWQGR